MQEALRLQHVPLIAEVHLVLGRTLLGLGRYQEAKSELKNAYQEADLGSLIKT